jgi:hypothetical protein
LRDICSILVTFRIISHTAKPSRFPFQKLNHLDMGADTLSVQTRGIYYNLPAFPAHDGKKYTAIVTGANGMTGASLVDVLDSLPERWGTIYAMSRRPPYISRTYV